MTGRVDLTVLPLGPTSTADAISPLEPRASRQLGWISVRHGLHLLGRGVPVYEDELGALLLTLEGLNGSLAAALHTALLQEFVQ